MPWTRKFMADFPVDVSANCTHLWEVLGIIMYLGNSGDAIFQAIWGVYLGLFATEGL